MALYPFDTIATRIKANKHQFNSFYQEIKFIFAHENFRSFFRGFTSTFPCSFVSNIVYFMAYENLNKMSKSYFDSIKTEHPTFNKLKYCIPLITSPLSELVSLMVYLPFDIVRTRLQVNLPEYEYKSLTHGVSLITKNEGLLRLYMASHLYLLNTCLYVGLQMWFYEMMRVILLKNVQRKSVNKLEFYESITASFIVSVVATIIVNPLDVVFTRYQIIDSQKEKLSTMKVVRDLIAHEGLKAFSKGMGAKLVGNVSLGVIWIPVYDYFKSIYGVELYD